jgi:ferredoxin/nitrate reductase gamma subunit
VAPLLLQVAASATREVQWNTTPVMRGFLYASTLVALGVFAWGCWTRVRIWRIGQPEVRWDRPAERLRRLLFLGAAQAGVLRDRLFVVPGVVHALVFFGFVALLGATIVVMIHHDLGMEIMRGRFYLYVQSLGVNVLAAVALVGVALTAVRRFVVRPARLEYGRRGDGLILASLFLILATGFLVSGARIAATGDAWGAWRPFSRMAGTLASAVWRSPDELRAAHAWLWMGHVALWHALLAMTPFTKLFHVFSSSASIFFGALDGQGGIPRVDFEGDAASVSLGINTPFAMTWKQLLDLDACTECGRCQAVCPAWAERKPLSPKRVILDLRDHVRARSAELLAAAAARRAGDQSGFDSMVAAEPSLAGGVIRAETLWACTTCRACESACPVSIEHVRLIVQLRQNLSMEQAVAPQGIVAMVNNLDTRQHPFGGVALDRTAWYHEAAAADGGGSARAE